jgi:metallophosphoesterase superfamily enzyme
VVGVIDYKPTANESVRDPNTGRQSTVTAGIYPSRPEHRAVMDAAFRERAVLLGETLVLADLHVGKVASSNVEFPLAEGDHLRERLAALVERHDPAEVVFAGDLLHSFDRVPTTAEGTVSALKGIVRDAGARPVVTPGNHDTMLETVWQGPTEHEYDLGRVPLPFGGAASDGTGTDGTGAGRLELHTVVCHGHAEPAADAECYVIGHDHPTITIEGQKWHCYLYGPGAYRGADVLMLPAFTHAVAGVSIAGRHGTATLNSPLLSDLDSFRPVVRDEDADATRVFPPLGEFRELL